MLCLTYYFSLLLLPLFIVSCWMGWESTGPNKPVLLTDYFCQSPPSQVPLHQIKEKKKKAISSWGILFIIKVPKRTLRCWSILLIPLQSCTHIYIEKLDKLVWQKSIEKQMVEMFQKKSWTSCSSKSVSQPTSSPLSLKA